MCKDARRGQEGREAAQSGGLEALKQVLNQADPLHRALARRHAVRGKELEEHTRLLSELEVGAMVQVQNQAGPHKNKWEPAGR